MIQRTPSMQSVELSSDSPQQTMEIAARLSALLKGGNLVALDGPLGSGKTQFVRGLAMAIGVDAKTVSSPTFVICQEYEVANVDARKSRREAATSNVAEGRAGHDAARVRGLVHIDAYRLSSVDELESIGWSEILAAGDVIIAVEWAERITAALPAERIAIRFAHGGSPVENSSNDVDGGTHRVLAITAPVEIIEQLQRKSGDSLATASANLVNCRTCGAPFDRNAKSFPFCSERCRLADLNQWFKGAYKMSREARNDEELSE